MNIKSPTLLYCTATLAVSSSFISSAAAQSVDAEPLTITARLWEESPQQVPASVTLIAKDELPESLEDLDQHVSNVRIEQSSVQTRAVIRDLI